MTNNWYLILVLWGNKYSAKHINLIIEAVFRHSSTCAQAILMTDRIREGIDSRVSQVVISDFFNCQERKQNYTTKLSLFDSNALPSNARCVYLDIDTVVTGDLAKLASLLKTPNDMFMLPPGGLIGFGALRRLIFKLSRQRRMATGNSSILAFHSGMAPNLCGEFIRLTQSNESDNPVLRNDDLFISWFGQQHLKAVPKNIGVMFRREFLTRSRLYGWIRNRLPWVRQRRDEIAAVTFNGVDHKLETLLTLPDGSLHLDSKGRSGRWSRAEMGPIKDKIVQASEALLSEQ